MGSKAAGLPVYLISRGRHDCFLRRRVGRAAPIGQVFAAFVNLELGNQG